MQNSFANIVPLPVGIQQPQGHRIDPPLLSTDPAANYKFNHCMLWITDPKKSLHFYVDLLGMRTIFGMNTGPFTVYYLGYPTTAAHQADLAKFAQDLLVPGEIVRTLGLLELAHLHEPEGHLESPVKSDEKHPAIGYGHLGFTVPDVELTLERLRQEGVQVIKNVTPKAASSTRMAPDGKWEAEELGIAREELPQKFRDMLDRNGFVRDPDGNMVEFVPQDA